MADDKNKRHSPDFENVPPEDLQHWLKTLAKHPDTTDGYTPNIDQDQRAKRASPPSAARRSGCIGLLLLALVRIVLYLLESIGSLLRVALEQFVRTTIGCLTTLLLIGLFVGIIAAYGYALFETHFDFVAATNLLVEWASALWNALTSQTELSAEPGQFRPG